jgi:hypothetical protein
MGVTHAYTEAGQSLSQLVLQPAVAPWLCVTVYVDTVRQGMYRIAAGKCQSTRAAASLRWLSGLDWQASAGQEVRCAVGAVPPKVLTASSASGQLRYSISSWRWQAQQMAFCSLLQAYHNVQQASSRKQPPLKLW